MEWSSGLVGLSSILDVSPWITLFSENTYLTLGICLGMAEICRCSKYKHFSCYNRDKVYKEKYRYLSKNSKVGANLNNVKVLKDSKGISVLRLPLMIDKVDYFCRMTYLMLVWVGY